MPWSDAVLAAAFVALAVVFRRGLVSDGFGFDRAFAAAFMRAKHGETMSLMFDLADEAGKRWGCIGCRCLARLVEPDHCAKTRNADGPPTAVLASYRAGALLFVLLLILAGVPWAVGRFL